jgi:rhodanese-related sulfurtransferase
MYWSLVIRMRDHASNDSQIQNRELKTQLSEWNSNSSHEVFDGGRQSPSGWRWFGVLILEALSGIFGRFTGLANASGGEECEKPVAVQARQVDSFTPSHVIELLDEAGARLLDVRADAEFDRVRVRGAVHIPDDALEEAIGLDFPNHSAAIICLGRDGKSSARAAAKLRGLGYHGAGFVYGGLRQWRRENFPVVKGKEQRSV